MASRRDQLHSYQFMVQRVVSALVMRETDPAQSPFRRAATAVVASISVAFLLVAGFGVYGVFTNRGDDGWRESGTVVIESETGARYLYKDGKLHPALNLASALLASGQANPKQRKVSRKSLVDVPRGVTIGVPNLPDSLPEGGDLLGMPWAVCTSVVKDSVKSAVVAGDLSKVEAGKPVPMDHAVFVKAGSSHFLLYHGRLFATTETAARDLSAGSIQATAVSTAFVNGLPKGQPVEQPQIPDAGKPSALFAPNNGPRWNNGQVLVIEGLDQTKRQYAVVRGSSLAMITQVQAALLLGEFLKQHDKDLHTEEKIPQSELSKYPNPVNLVPDPNDLQQPPATLPDFSALGAGGLCALYRDDTGVTELRSEVALDLQSRPATAGRSSGGAVYADYVLLPGGKGAIVASGQTLSLVTDQGVRYAAAKPEVLGMLGYSGKAPLKLPSSLVSLLPEGPGLDPYEALSALTVA